MWKIYFLIFLSPLPFASTPPFWRFFWVAYIGFFAAISVFRSRREIFQRIPKGFYFSLFGPVLVLMGGAVQVFLGFTIFMNQTIMTSAIILSHLLWFWLVLNAFDKPNKVLDFILVVALIITCYGAYGLIAFFSGDESILWFEKWASKGALTSTFINRNSFAAFAGIGLQCILAYSFWFTSRKLSPTDTGGHKILTFLVNNYSWVIVLLLSGIVLLNALLFTGSRGGISTTLLACLGIVGGLVFLVRDKKARRRKLFFVVGLFISIAATISISGDNFLKRIGSLDTGDMRFKIYERSLEAIQDRPYLGTGLGTFADAFTQYRSSDVFPGPVPVLVLRAHSDVIELAVTVGVPIATIALISYLYAIIYFFRSALEGHRYSVFLLLNGALLVQLGLHSIIDFPFQVPAVSYLFTALMAAGVYLANMQVEHSSNGGRCR